MAKLIRALKGNKGNDTSKLIQVRGNEGIPADKVRITTLPNGTRVTAGSW
jgi:hypothetical protein